MHENGSDSYQHDFVSRVSGLPIVNTALRAYEHSKASSRVVKVSSYTSSPSVMRQSLPLVRRRDDGVVRKDHFKASH